MVVTEESNGPISWDRNKRASAFMPHPIAAELTGSRQQQSDIVLVDELQSGDPRPVRARVGKAIQPNVSLPVVDAGSDHNHSVKKVRQTENGTYVKNPSSSEAMRWSSNWCITTRVGVEPFKKELI